MGQMLLDLHVPFDYIIAERDLDDTVALLEKYKTIVIPNVACMTDETINALTAYLNAGGSVIATKDTGKYDLDRNVRSQPGLNAMTGQSITGATNLTVGAGRFVYFDDSPEVTHWHNNPRDFNLSPTLSYPSPPPASVIGKLDWAFNGTLLLETDAAISTVIIPSQKDDQIFLHLVNYNVYPDASSITADTNINISITIPAGRRVTNVSAVSPDFPGEQATISWTVDGGNVLICTLEALQYYSVIVVELGPKLELKISRSAGNSETLDFEWDNGGALSKVYDLEFVESLMSLNWLPYNDGMATYSGIHADRSGTNILSSVLTSGPQAFFRLVENPSLIADDNFSSYNSGAINGQAGSLVGFSGVWLTTPDSCIVSSSSLIVTKEIVTTDTGAYQYAQRNLVSWPNNIASTGKTYTLAAIGFSADSGYLQLGAGTGGPFSATSLLLGSNDGGFWLIENGGDSVSAVGGSNDGAVHTWLIEYDLDTGYVRAWKDPNVNSFDSSSPTLTHTLYSPSTIVFNSIMVLAGTVGATTTLDSIKIGRTLQSIGVVDVL